MASRHTETAKPEENQHWKWLRENRPHNVVNVWTLGSLSAKPHETTVRDLTFGHTSFIAKCVTQENEERPCGITETAWTITWVPTVSEHGHTSHPYLSCDKTEQTRIQQGGGLKVYSFYNDD